MSAGWTEDDIPRLNPQRVERIRALLTDALAPETIEVVDDSHKHAGHAGARGGQGHFGVDIVSAAFAGKLPLAPAGVCRAGRHDADRYPCAGDPRADPGRGCVASLYSPIGPRVLAKCA